MIERNQVEKLLKLNGIEPTAKNEEIRSILLSARYNEDEVDAAIMVLREDKKTHKTHVDGLHKVFRSDTPLNQTEISNLLGIDIDLSDHVPVGSKARQLSTGGQVFMIALAVILALVAIGMYMYIYKMGIFHHTAALGI